MYEERLEVERDRNEKVYNLLLLPRVHKDMTYLHVVCKGPPPFMICLYNSPPNLNQFIFSFWCLCKLPHTEGL